MSCWHSIVHGFFSDQLLKYFRPKSFSPGFKRIPSTFYFIFLHPSWHHFFAAPLFCGGGPMNWCKHSGRHSVAIANAFCTRFLTFLPAVLRQWLSTARCRLVGLLPPSEYSFLIVRTGGVCVGCTAFLIHLRSWHALPRSLGRMSRMQQEWRRILRHLSKYPRPHSSQRLSVVAQLWMPCRSICSARKSKPKG